MPKLRGAARELLAKWPDKIRIITVDVNENEVAHLLNGIKLRMQPWQYTMPKCFFMQLVERRLSNQRHGAAIRRAPNHH